MSESVAHTGKAYRYTHRHMSRLTRARRTINQSTNQPAADASGWKLSSGLGDTIDLHAYPGPQPKPKMMRRWYGDGLLNNISWLTSRRRASVLGEFGGLSFRLEVRGGAAVSGCEGSEGRVGGCGDTGTARRVGSGEGRECGVEAAGSGWATRRQRMRAPLSEPHERRGRMGL